MRIGFIGAGKAGNSLARHLYSPQTTISGFYSRTHEHAKDAADDTKSVAFFNIKEVISESDIIFITTPDSVIESIWNQIKGELAKEDINGKIFCHCSGSLSAKIFEESKCLNVYTCSVHPMQAISSKDTDLANTFFTMDGDDEAIAVISQLLEAKGNPVGIIASECKQKYHMAASTASNLVVGLIQMSIDALKECGFTQTKALAMLTPLITGNIRNVCENGTVAALTGPVERSDCKTVISHMNELSGEQQEIYRLLSKQLISVAQEKNPKRNYSELVKILEEKDQ